MNFKYFLFILLTLFIIGCGVKDVPLKYPDTAIQSYTQDYTGAEPTPEELERIKNKNIIPSSTDPKLLETPIKSTNP